MPVMSFRNLPNYAKAFSLRMRPRSKQISAPERPEPGFEPLSLSPQLGHHCSTISEAPICHEAAHVKVLTPSLGVPSPQSQSALLNLPFDIRQSVYEHVYGFSTFHLEATRDGHKTIKCPDYDAHGGWDGHVHGIRGGKAEDALFLHEEGIPASFPLSLSLSCRLL